MRAQAYAAQRHILGGGKLGYFAIFRSFLRDSGRIFFGFSGFSTIASDILEMNKKIRPELIDKVLIYKAESKLSEIIKRKYPSRKSRIFLKKSEIIRAPRIFFSV